MRSMAAAGIPAILLALAGAARADVVVSVDGRFEGAAVPMAGGIEVTAAGGAKIVAWDGVIAWAGMGDPPVEAGPQALRLLDGEIWQVDLISMRAGKTLFSSPFTGEKEVETRLLAGLDFVPGLRPGGRPGMLERERGESMPGTIAWMDRDRLAIQGPLGPVTVKRDGLSRYTFPAAPVRPMGGDATGTRASAPALDEAMLSDGAVLRGKLSVLPDASGLALDHPILGRIALPRAALRSISRSPAGVIDLAASRPRSAARPPLIASPSEEPAVEVIRGSRAFARGLRIEARADVRFELPPGEGRRLRLVVVPARESRGAVRLRVHAAGTTVFDEEIDAGAPARPVEAELGGAGDLRIEVEPGAAIRFPAAVVLGDPHVLAGGAARRP